VLEVIHHHAKFGWVRISHAAGAPKMLSFFVCLLWSPYVIGQTIYYIFIPSFVILLSFFLSFFPRLISAVAEWMSAILAHMVWP